MIFKKAFLMLSSVRIRTKDRNYKECYDETINENVQAVMVCITRMLRDNNNKTKLHIR